MPHNPSTQKKRRPPKKITKTYLENAGLYYLERYASSSENFRRVMQRKIFRSAKHHEQNAEDFYPLLDEIIERYKSSGLLNDDLYCFSRVRSLYERGHSQRMIYTKLMQKGLTRDQITTAIAEYIEREGYNDQKECEYKAAEKYARKRRLGPYRIPPQPERYEKDIAAMARAGFSYSVTKSVLQQVLDQDDV